MTWRPPHFKKAYDYVAGQVGEETARRLCATNPKAAVEGGKWPRQPEPLGLLERVPLKFNARRYAGTSAASDQGAPKTGRRRLWDRLFAR
jgi:hypothetical protein